MMGKEDWVMYIEEEDKASVKELERPQMPMQPSIHDWVKIIEEEVHGEGDSHSQSQSQQQLLCIYMVPAWLKALHAGAYEPHAVALGPYHYANPNLKPMEKHKHRAFLTFLRRAKAPLAAITEAMTAVAEQLKSSYEGLDDLSRYLDTKETKEQLYSLEERFLQLMIVDGCFILELLRVRMAWQQGEPTGYEDTDPVFSEHGVIYMTAQLRRDMLMLENQLPMLALTTIAEVAQIGLQQKQQLNEHVRSFFGFQPANIDTTSWDDSLHILHMYIQIMSLSGSYSPTTTKSSDTRWSATELHEGGVKFSKSETLCFKDISFDPSKGILSLPPLYVADVTEAVLLNLMAFEQLHVGAGETVSAYVNLMDTLIDSARDVELLRNKEIVTGWVGSDETIAKIFNRIAKEADLTMTQDPNGVDVQLSNYRNNRLNRWRASFVHTYLRNPWVFFSLLGALILLFLTVFQDVYTALQYYQS